MKTNIFSLLLLSLICTVSPVKAETFLAQQLKENKYPQTSINKYIQACIPKAKERGLSQEEAQKLCQCTIKEFQKRYTLSEYNRLRERANRNNQSADKLEAADKLEEVGGYCFEELFM